MEYLSINCILFFYSIDIYTAGVIIIIIAGRYYRYHRDKMWHDTLTWDIARNVLMIILS